MLILGLPLIQFAVIAVIGLIVVGVLVTALLAAQKRQSEMNARLAMVRSMTATGPNLLSLRTTSRVALPGEGPKVPSFIVTMAQIFGADPDRPYMYSTPWWLIAGMGVLIGSGAAAYMILAMGLNPLLAVPISFAIGIGFPRLIVGGMAEKYRSKLYQQMPDALSMIVRAVRAGIPVGEAIRIVAREVTEPTRTEFSRLADELRIGIEFDEALKGLAKRTGLPEYRFFSVAVGLQHRSGGSLTDTLENLADVIRKRIVVRMRGYALAAEARMSISILAGIPFAVGILLTMLNPAYMSVFVRDPRGHMLLGIAVGLLLLGLSSMRQIIKRALR
ncbi:MAG: type II secretion system F family protein [Alphaproteobacteria bacterium]|nr:type II secretion system F family protein [Alphaproteobacteria bacterium]